MTLDTGWALAWIRRTAEVVRDNRTALVALDREIGDGDHGENLDRGFHAVVEALEAQEAPATPGAVFTMVATKLISTVGGASGPLLGTAFLRAGQAAGDRTELDASAVAAVLGAARDGVVSRGKAAPGDKTMVDAWAPAVDAAEAAAESGAAATEPLVARKGRASYLGERAIGHRDPGAQSSALILRAAVDAAGGAA
jgi:dihydroxyacetone kinase-like protein